MTDLYTDHDALMARLRERLTEHQHAPLEIDGYRASAVAVLLVPRDGRTHVVLTVRSKELRAHAGQIAFPGGRHDDGDESFAHTARREAEEELGISPARITVLGRLDDEPTPTRFIVTPIIAELDKSTVLTPNPDEVAEVFDAPLSLFADPSAAQDWGTREFFGVTYRLRAFKHGGHTIWGVTARVLEQLVVLLA